MLAWSAAPAIVTTSSGYTGGLPGAAEHMHVGGERSWRSCLPEGGASLHIVGVAAEHEIASVRGCFMGMLLAELDWRRIEILNNYKWQ